MRSSLIIALKKIKKRKIQTLLIGVIVASSSLLFSTGLGIMISMNGPIDKMFAEAKSSHDVFVFSEKDYDKRAVQNWWESQNEVDMVQMYNELTLGSNIKVNGEKMRNQCNLLSEVPQSKGDIDNFKMIEGNETKYPGEGEVWVSTGFANQYKVKIGDTLAVENMNYKISGIIVDTEFSSIMMGTKRFWVKPGELKRYSEYNANPGYLISIRYKKPSSSDTVWQRFEKHLNSPVVGMSIAYKDTYQCYSLVLKYTGVFMMFFSFIIIMTAICIIRFVISNSIYNDYKNIGIYKALGFSPGGINSVYVLQYLIISFISIVIGIFFSKFTIDKMMVSSLKEIGMDTVKMPYTIPFAVTFIIIILVVALTAFLCALKTKSIKPVEAIREENIKKYLPGKGDFGTTMFKIFPPAVAVGLKGIANNKKSAVIICITILITLYSGLSGINLLNTAKSINENMGYWGFDNSMVDIKLNVNDDKLFKQIENDIKIDDKVKSFTTFSFYQGASFVDKYGSIEKLAVSQALGPNSAGVGFMDMQGRDPEKANEVSVSVNTSRDNNVHIGDYMQVYIKNKKYNLLVVGIYQSLNNLGKGIRLYCDTVKDADSDFIPEVILNLKNSDDMNSYINSMGSKYGDKVSVTKRQDTFKDELSMMSGGSIISVIMIIVIMLSICSLNTFNIILMNINEERKSYGIYKAIGMTSRQIRDSIAFRNFIIFFAALIFALPLTLKATPELMSLIFINIGIAKYPISISIPGMVIMTLICLVFTILSTYAASRMIAGIKLRSLIEE